MKIELRTQLTYRGHGCKRQLVEKRDDFIYVPLLQTLQAMLKNDEILQEVRIKTYYTKQLMALALYVH